MKVITSSIGIQKTRFDKGLAAQLGFSEATFRTAKVALDDAGNARVREIVAQALEGAIDAIVGRAVVADSEKPALIAGLLRNIEGFELCSGSGFTGELEATLKADPQYADIWTVKGESTSSNGAEVASVEF